MKKSRNLLRALSGALLAAALLATGGSAVAQTESVPAPAAGLRTTPIGRMRLSFSLVPAPLGSFESTVPVPFFDDVGVSVDMAVAFGLRPAFDYSINDYFFVGFSPQLLLNVKGQDADDAGKALDLLLRVGAHAPVAEKIHLYAFLSPGYSIIYPPARDEDPAGFVLGVTAGGMYSFTDRLFASADIGYQLGFQEVTFLGADYDFHLRYLLIGLGVGMRL